VQKLHAWTVNCVIKFANNTKKTKAIIFLSNSVIYLLNHIKHTDTQEYHFPINA